jgi:hypothetical protein
MLDLVAAEKAVNVKQDEVVFELRLKMTAIMKKLTDNEEEEKSIVETVKKQQQHVNNILTWQVEEI